MRVLEYKRLRFKFHLYHLPAICLGQITRLLWALVSGKWIWKELWRFPFLYQARKFEIPKGSFLSPPVLLMFSSLMASITLMVAFILFVQAPHRFLSQTQISPLICGPGNSTWMMPKKPQPSPSPPLPHMALFQSPLSQAVGSPSMLFHKPKTWVLSLTAASPCPQYSIHQQLYQV